MDPRDQLTVMTRQLGRMRGMTRFYHERFFSDTRFTAIAVLVLLLVGWWGVPEAFLLIPVVALVGANQTAFDASYLYFARHYAARLETEINRRADRPLLVGAELEDSYLFPLSTTRLVGVAGGAGFSWFGWMTILYTLLGMGAYVAGLLLGWSTLLDAGRVWTAGYLVALALATVASLGVGWWWFVAGVGEARLGAILDRSFP